MRTVPARSSTDSPARVLVVWCPDWPVVSAEAPPGAPVVVVAAGHVVACSTRARADGVKRGQRLRDAQRACPGLVVRDDDPDHQARMFEQVVVHVEQRCPRVEVVRPGVCALPARGPARYFGGERALADLVHETVVGETGFDARVGIADGLFAALLAARTDEPRTVVASCDTEAFLADHPVNVLDRPELAGLLVRLGLRTLGEFAALPSDDVLARFGVDGATAHRLARGLEPRLLAPRDPGRDLTVARAFDPPVEEFERVVFVAKTLADELHNSLADLGLSCVRVEVEVATEDGRRWSRLWRHDGLLSATAVAERVRWQLDAWRTATGADEALTGGLVSLRLVPDQLVADDGRQLALWGESAPDERVDRAASRVQAMLGHAAVTRPVLGGGRGPGERVTRVPWGDSVNPAVTHPAAPLLPVEGGWPGRVPAPLPAAVPSPPVPASLVAADDAVVTVDDRNTVSAPPARLTVDGVAGGSLTVVGWTGPWPAREYWWDPARASESARFQVTTDDGRAWLLAVRGDRWELEGRY